MTGKPCGTTDAENDPRPNAALAALEVMPRRARTVFVLHRFEGWSYTRIAAHLRISTGAVERAMRDAMTALADALEP